ncbi:MAG TPA: hypothetical protein VF789_27255 [Thermoanaerobaculia bacterium]
MPDSTIKTNRDLYLAVTDLTAAQKPCPRSLEEYLRALWVLGRTRREQPSLSGNDLLEMLSSAFSSPIPDVEDDWRARYNIDDEDLSGYEGWEARLLRQVVDLREMAEQGQLADEYRYFGISAPRGSQWYNFDPCTFLECGTVGCFGGWEPEDETGRTYVPGPVAVMDENGQIVSVDPRDVPNPVVSILEIRWEDFRDFLEYGQTYE